MPRFSLRHRGVRYVPVERDEVATMCNGKAEQVQVSHVT
jgi:hypothetical protein